MVVLPEPRGEAAVLRAAGAALVFRAAGLRGVVFLAALVRDALRDEACRAVPLVDPCRDRDAVDVRVDLPAFRAPPRAVLRADDLDRLLDDALRLAMS